MPRPLRVVNCAEVAASDWRFLEGQIDAPPQQWKHVRAVPSNAIERAVSRPNLGRWRGCLQSALTARSWNADVVVTHLPRVSAWYGLAAPSGPSAARHLAFSFNFTTLPGPAMAALMRRAFRDVDRFVVYASAERALYARTFDIDPARIDVLPWAMEVPTFDEGSSSSAVDPGGADGYVCSVGGEARDYASFIEVARRMPRVKFIVVTRPYAIEGLQFPDNVEVQTNVPATAFWSVVRGARAVMLPLRDAETNCGHISLVGCMQLGTPIVTTYSLGTDDYVRDGDNALLGAPQDVDALANNTQRLLEDTALAQRLVARGKAFTELNCRPERWTDYWARYLRGAQPPASFIEAPGDLEKSPDPSPPRPAPSLLKSARSNAGSWFRSLVRQGS